MTRRMARAGSAARWLLCALLASGATLPAAKGCGLGDFQGTWVGTDGRGDRFAIDANAVVVSAGPARARIPMQPDRDILERRLEAVMAALPQVTALHGAMLARLGPPARPVCVLQVRTPGGGSMAFIPDAEGLLRLEEARADAPVAQPLRRAIGAPVPDAPVDYRQPPR